MNVAAAREVIERHGLDPDAGLDALAAAVEGRGWRVGLEEIASRRGAGWVPRWRALATRPVGRERLAPRPRARLVGSGPSARHALVMVLAQALEREL